MELRSFCSVFAFLVLLNCGLAHKHDDEKYSKGRIAAICEKKSWIIEPEWTQELFDYGDPELARNDMIDGSDGKSGIPLNLTITVLDITTCTPIPKAAVHIWHCGIYSSAENITFHRGMVLTDSYGAATFNTTYPGWCVGRTTHIHLKVHINQDDSINDQIYQSPLYAKTPSSASRVLNAQDSIYNEMNGRGMLHITPMNSEGYEGGVYGKITIVVDTTAPNNGGSRTETQTDSPSDTSNHSPNLRRVHSKTLLSQEETSSDSESVVTIPVGESVTSSVLLVFAKWIPIIVFIFAVLNIVYLYYST